MNIRTINIRYLIEVVLIITFTKLLVGRVLLKAVRDKKGQTFGDSSSADRHINVT